MQALMGALIYTSRDEVAAMATGAAAEQGILQGLGLRKRELPGEGGSRGTWADEGGPGLMSSLDICSMAFWR